MEVINDHYIILPLYSPRENNVYSKSGINQWNAGGRTRNIDEVYIPIPSWIHNTFNDFFEYSKYRKNQNESAKNYPSFYVELPNKEKIICRVVQSGGKALMSDPNKDLGKWILRDLLQLEPGTVVDINLLNEAGIDSVKLIKKNEKLYFLEPAMLGSYKEFEKKFRYTNNRNLLRKIEMQKYDFSDIKYDPVKEKIQDLMVGHDKDKVRNLTVLDMPSDTWLKVYKTESTFPKDLTLEQWQGVFDYIAKGEKKTIGLMAGAVNDAKISNEPGSQWQRYKNALKNKKFSANSINNIEQSSYHILQRLSKNTLKEEAVKGLVVGSVQSGKTANMIGLMSMAADYGFNFFIVFSGMIDSLREQTENRMFKDLNLDGTNKKLEWNKLSNPSLRDRRPELQWQSINLEPMNNNRYFTVALKNINRMRALRNWLYSDENKSKQLKVLIIDDEADQASVNTRKIEEGERTSINDTMLEIVDGYRGKKLGAVNYISYTATPYANVLNESGGLFPKDFVFTLPLSEDYIGPKEIFGLQEPEESPKLHIVRSITKFDDEKMEEIHKGISNEIPDGLKEAIIWFFITVCMYRIYGYKTPISMLVHTSFRTSDHDNLYSAIRGYLLSIQCEIDSFIEEAHRIYTRETVDLPIEDFIKAMPDYSTKDDIKDYPSFTKVEKQMRRVLNEQNDNYISHIPINDDGTLRYHEGFHIVIDNSVVKSKEQNVRLIYPTEQQTRLAPMFIVIGGNTLSRGLTLEGLTTSYFSRNTKQADTLFQMGRWFGYRKGYELLPRVWLNSLVRERFQYISQINEELIETIEEMSIQDEKPLNLGVKVKNSPDNQLLRITSSNKMQAAVEKELDFSGINKQTIILTDNENLLTHNLILTKDFLAGLGKSKLQVKGSLFVWKDVLYEDVKDFLSNFKFSKRDSFFSKIEMFINWFDQILEENSQQFSNWSVILSTKETSGNTKYELYDKKFAPVYRSSLSKEKDEDDTISIGALRSPNHLLADLENPPTAKTSKRKEINNIRRVSGYGTVPQIIIYIIDKDSTPQEGAKARFPLKFSNDIVGINLYVPGQETSKNMAKYLTVDIQNDEIDIEETEEDY